MRTESDNIMKGSTECLAGEGLFQDQNHGRAASVMPVLLDDDDWLGQDRGGRKVREELQSSHHS